MRKMIALAAILLALGACQPDEEPGVPRAVLEWQPTPHGERSLPAGVFLPTPEPSRAPPQLDLAAEDTAAPVHVPELAPTPIPANVYVIEATGFMVPHASGWEATESDDQSVILFDPLLNVNLNVSSEFSDEEASYESFLETILSELAEFAPDMTVISEEEIPFAGDGVANVALLASEEEGDDDFSIWLAYAKDDSQSFRFVAFGAKEDVEARQASLKSIVGQVEPGGVQIYGLDRAETLVVRGGDPIARDLDPARQTGSAAGLIGLLYSGLVRLTPELGVEPDLAESWAISEDGRVYTFTLRDDLKFRSGKPITAADFVYSLERATDPETDSTTAATYLGDILGVSEKMAGEADSIAGLEVIDDQTLEMTLEGPRPYFLIKLTYPTSFVVDEESVDPEDEDWAFEPNESGPFTLEEFHSEAAMIYAPNENYHSPPELPHLVQLLYRIGSTASLFESGELDIAYVGGNEAKRVREPEDALHDRWSSTTAMCTSFVRLNNTIPPMDDPEVRRAFSLAVDKENLNELINEGLDLVAHNILPPAMPGYSAERASELAVRGYDPEAAQEALAASGYADGLPPITLNASGFATADRQDINALVANWQEVLGSEVVVEYLDPQDFVRAARENPGHMVIGGWCADYPDPENFLDILFHSDSEFNYSSYTNPDVDALLEEARSELDPERRLALYQQIESMLLEDVAAIPLDHGVSDVLVNPRVRGFVLAPMGAPIFHRLSLDVAEGSE